MKKLTGKEINYILGVKDNTKIDWMFEGMLEELDDGSYHLVVYMKKPVYYIIRPLLYPFAFIYFVLEGGIKEAKEDLKERCGREIADFRLFPKEREKAEIVRRLKGE